MRQTFFKEVKVWLRDMCFLSKIRIRLWMAIQLADYKHYINSKRYFVLPDGNSGGIIVAQRDELKVLKKRGVIDKRNGYVEFSRIAFYMTPTYRGGTDAPTLGEKMAMREKYIKYMRIVRPIMNKSKIGIPNKL